MDSLGVVPYNRSFGIVQERTSLRITFVLADDNLSGGVRIIAQHASRLKRRGHDVTVVARPGRRPSLGGRLRALLREGRWLGTDPLKESYFDGSGVDVKELESYRAVGEQDVPDADVVIATFWTTSAWVMALSSEIGRASCRERV